MSAPKDMTQAQLEAALDRHGISHSGTGDEAVYGGYPVRTAFGRQLPGTRRGILAWLIARKDADAKERAGRATDFARGARIVWVNGDVRRHVVVMCPSTRNEHWYVAIDRDGRRLSVRKGYEARAHSKREGDWTGPTSVLDALQRERARAVAAVAKIDAEIADEARVVVTDAEEYEYP